MQSSAIANQPNSEITLNDFQLQRLTLAIQGLSGQQLHWASGYLAGLSVTQQPHLNETKSQRATILYATHTGNGRSIAEKLAADAQQQGINSRVLSVADYKPRDLTKEQILILVISTHGEGEPPESAAELHRYLFNERTPKLDHLNFSIFALGDSSYEFFCQAGKEIDERFESLGANRLLPRIDADVSFQEAASSWSSEVIEHSKKLIPEHTDNVISLSGTPTQKRSDRFNPFQGTIIDNRRITTDQAIAKIHHIAIEIDPQVVRYQPGDALGILSKNSPELVAEIIEATGLDADAMITIDKEEFSLPRALQDKLELTLLHPTVVSQWAQLSNSETLLSLADDARKLREFAQDRQLIDLINEFPAEVDAETLVSVLQALQPRLYSISSSQLVSEDEVQLTVSAVSYEAHGREHLGTASNFLTDRIEQDDLISVYVAENTHFRLPANNDTPIIMIGAGTGIAPYRAFLQQRQADEAKGKNWLIFGNRNFKHDFLYQQDWINFRKAGLLDRVSLAFSRDTTTRAYIQDKLREEGEMLYEWIQQGAHIYVCGGMEMEKGVRESLVEIINTYGANEEQDAETTIENLRAEGRYLRDVY